MKVVLNLFSGHYLKKFFSIRIDKMRIFSIIFFCGFFQKKFLIMSQTTTSTTVHSKLSPILNSQSTLQSTTKKINLDSGFSINSNYNTISSSFRPAVFGASHTFVCGTGKNCLRINEYAIASNYSFNCREAFLPIIFEIVNSSNSKFLSFGYLPADGKLIQEDQKTTGICKKIKRLFLFIKIK